MHDLDLRQNLDHEQYEAVMSPAERLLCLANAGSGKTRVLTTRAANFIHEGFPPESILMLTFMKKAANEMRGRIGRLLDMPVNTLMAGTFHGVACRLIRENPYYSRLPEKFTIFDTDDGLMIANTALKDIVDHDNTLRLLDGRPRAKDILRLYSWSRNTGGDFHTALEDAYDPEQDSAGEARVHLALDVVERYEQFKQSTPGLDFDDMLLKFLDMLDNPYFLSYMRNRFAAVFVDEYQDINLIQHDIIRKLAGPRNYLTAVGDDAQCIYGFRGSMVSYIRDFPDEFPGCGIIHIPSNYRSSKEIVETSLKVLNGSGYHDGEPKSMTSAKGPNGVPVRATLYYNEQDQAAAVAARCKSAGKRMLWSDIAVLVRSNADAAMIEKALLKARVPVSMECGTAFYQKQQIRIAIRFLRFLYLPADKTALAGFLDTCPGVGATTRDRLFEALMNGNYDLDVFGTLKARGKRPNELLDGLRGAVLDADALLKNGKDTPGQLAEPFLRLYLRPWCEAQYGNQARHRLAELDTFQEQLDIYEHLEDFLDDASLNTGEAMDDGNGRVRVLTIHRAKGLEFRKVILPSMSDGLCPCPKQFGCDEELAEELRVLYVAMTRAMEELDIMAVRRSRRHTDENGKPREMSPSRFLKAIRFTKA